MNYKFPWMKFENQLHTLYKYLLFKRRFKAYGENSFVSPFSEIINMQNILIGNDVTVARDGWLFAITEYAQIKFSPEIEIGHKTYIGRRVTLSCANKIKIGKDVTIGDDVYIADCTHSYEDIATNVTKQKLLSGKIVIGDRAWIGKNSVILFDLEIGENAVVGANSFVNKSVPPYTVVCGNPAKPIKKYDFDKREWVQTR